MLMLHPSRLRWLVCLAGPALGSCAAAAKPPALELSLAHRSRFESVDPQFRPSFPPSDQALVMRTIARVDATWPRLRLTGEVMDSRAELNARDAPTSTAIVNALEPIQLKAAWSLLSDETGRRSTLALGWLTKDIGGRRLVARNNFRNTVNAFAGLDWSWRSAAGLELDAFYLHPMRRLPELPEPLYANEQRRDEVPSDTVLAGLHLRTRLGEARTIGEVLLLRSDGPDPRAPDSGAHDLDTLSLRLSQPSERGAWDFEAEAIGQRGSSRPIGGAPALDHRATFLHLSAGYTFDTLRRPRVVAQYDYASGDEDPTDGRSERFDTLYGARSFELGPSGIYGPFARSNLETLGLRGTVQLSSRWTAMTALRGFWLASAKDAWIETGLQDPTGSSGDYIGRQLESWVSWAPRPGRLSFQLGLVHLRYGRFALTVPQATGRTHTTYLYGQLSYRFARSLRP